MPPGALDHPWITRLPDTVSPGFACRSASATENKTTRVVLFFAGKPQQTAETAEQVQPRGEGEQRVLPVLFTAAKKEMGKIRRQTQLCTPIRDCGNEFGEKGKSSTS